MRDTVYKLVKAQRELISRLVILCRVQGYNIGQKGMQSAKLMKRIARLEQKIIDEESVTNHEGFNYE